MNSDDLGEKGQQRFGEWCADVGLICNPSTRDRAGWDFIVDFRHQPSMSSLDHRPGPLSCVVQLKTVLKTTTSVRLRLDMAERLAKDSKPSFIVAPIVDGLDVVDVRIWHIRGEHLAAILKRLRKEQKKGSVSNLDKKYISFSTSSGVPVAPAGKPLKEFFEASCPEGMLSYAVAKKKECMTLGFDARSIEMQFAIETADPLRVLDFFLGTVTDEPATILSTVETRFGIALPLRLGDVKGRITVEPASTGRGLIRIEAEEFHTPLVDQAHVFSAPFEVGGYQRLSFRGKHLTVTVTRGPDGCATVTINWVEAVEGFRLSDWVNRAMARQVSTLSDAVIVLVQKNLEEFPVRLTLPSSALDRRIVRDAAWSTSAARAVNLVAEHAGEDPEHVWTTEEMNEACLAALVLALLLDGAVITCEGSGPVDAFDEQAIVVVGTVPLGEKTLAWHGHIRTSAIQLFPVLRLKMDGFKLKGARRLMRHQTLADFAEVERKRAGVEDSIWVAWKNGVVAGVFQRALAEVGAIKSGPRGIDDAAAT